MGIRKGKKLFLACPFIVISWLAVVVSIFNFVNNDKKIRLNFISSFAL